MGRGALFLPKCQRFLFHVGIISPLICFNVLLNTSFMRITDYVDCKLIAVLMNIFNFEKKTSVSTHIQCLNLHCHLVNGSLTATCPERSVCLSLERLACQCP